MSVELNSTDLEGEGRGVEGRGRGGGGIQGGREVWGMAEITPMQQEKKLSQYFVIFLPNYPVIQYYCDNKM